MSIASYLARMDEAMRGGVYTHQIAKAKDGTGPGTGQVTSSFPRYGLGTADPRDELVRMKMEMINEHGKTGQTPFGQVVLSDEDVQYLIRKRETEGEANFDAWLGANFHTDSVTIRQWLQRIYPKFYDDRESAMINKAKTALRICRILDKGPQDEEDLILQFGLQNGLIQLESNWNVIGPNKRDPKMDKQALRFQDRLMAKRRYKTDDERATAAEVDHNPFTMGKGKTGQFAFSGGNVGPTSNRYGDFLDKVFQTPKQQQIVADAQADALADQVLNA